MSSKYFLSITKTSGEQGAEHLAFAYGDLEEVNFIARRQLQGLIGSEEKFVVYLVETDAASVGAIGDDSLPQSATVQREVTSFAGDGDTAAVVLKRKLAAERKQAADAAQSTEPEPELPDTEV